MKAFVTSLWFVTICIAVLRVTYTPVHLLVAASDQILVLTVGGFTLDALCMASMMNVVNACVGPVFDEGSHSRIESSRLVRLVSSQPNQDAVSCQRVPAQGRSPVERYKRHVGRQLSVDRDCEAGGSVRPQRIPAQGPRPGERYCKRHTSEQFCHFKHF